MFYIILYDYIIQMRNNVLYYLSSLTPGWAALWNILKIFLLIHAEINGRCIGRIVLHQSGRMLPATCIGRKHSAVGIPDLTASPAPREHIAVRQP